jgi:hypothetical protein
MSRSARYFVLNDVFPALDSVLLGKSARGQRRAKMSFPCTDKWVVW